MVQVVVQALCVCAYYLYVSEYVCDVLIKREYIAVG